MGEIDKDNLNIEKGDNKNNIIIDETLSKEKSNEENIKENIDEEKSVEIKSIIDDKSNNDDVVMGESSIDTEIIVPSNGKSNDDIPMKELSEEKIEDKKRIKKRRRRRKRSKRRRN